MKKAGAIAARFGVHPDTVRDWTDTFEEFFSEGSRKGAGVRRIYTPDDETVLNTIFELRKRNTEFEEIRARLRNNERIEVLPATNEPIDDASAVEIFGKLKSLERVIEEKDKQIAELKADLNTVRNLDQQEFIRLNSKIAVLEFQLEQLKGSKE